MIRRVLLLATAGLWACSSPTVLAEPHESGRIFGILEYPGQPVRVEVPTLAEVGEPFVVEVTTYDGECVSQGETVSEVEGLRATVTPYDRISPDFLAGQPCADLDVFELFTHSTTLRFDIAGTAEVVIRGKREPSGEVIVVKRTVAVE